MRRAMDGPTIFSIIHSTEISLTMRVRLASTVSQDGYIVADSQNLFESVRDIDDGDAMRLEIADDAEQDFHLRGAERGTSVRP